MFYIELAGCQFQIENLYPKVHMLCKDYEVKQKLIDGNGYIQNESFKQIKIEQKDIQFERMKSKAEDIREGIPVRNFTDAYLETLAVYRKIAEQMIAYDTILFHGSAIAVDGIGYLFTAKSGTGKSTHTRLWREYFGERAVMVNDDKPLLKVTQEGVMVYGTPWDGKHRLSNHIMVPLKAICILTRNQTNCIEKVSSKAFYVTLLQQMYRSLDAVKMSKELNLLEQIIHKVEIYSLGCNMDPEAAIVAYEGMQK